MSLFSDMFKDFRRGTSGTSGIRNAFKIIPFMDNILNGQKLGTGYGVKAYTEALFPGWGQVSEKITGTKLANERIGLAKQQSKQSAEGLERTQQGAALLSNTGTKNIADVNSGGTASVTVGAENIFRRNRTPTASTGVTIGL